MEPSEALCWIDGRVVPEAVVREDATARARLDAPGCFTTARVQTGRIVHAARHVERLLRDAHRLGLGEIEPTRCGRVLEEIAGVAFGAGDGIVRLQASGSNRGTPHLCARTRARGEDPGTWTAVTAPFPHRGPSAVSTAKSTPRLLYDRAAESARRAGADEALLLDEAGRFVEGARTNLFFVREDGRIATPPLARGAVAGIARALVLERIPGVVEEDLGLADAARAREIVCTNAARGARPVVRLGGRPVGSGCPGPVAERLARALEAD